jgi:hypothetical protein
MAFSGKAEEIHNQIVNSGKAGEWIGISKSYVSRKGQYEAGPNFRYDRNGLRERLKSELGKVFPQTDDGHWDEIADWLFRETVPNA